MLCLLRNKSLYALTVLFAFVATHNLVSAQDLNETAAQPNVLLIISDDQAWTDFGFMGHPAIKTPALDKLAAQSATFTRGYVPSSLCRPSLMSMITGQFPSQHGITSNDPPAGVDRKEMLRHSRAAKTLPELLAPAGYLSLQTGKWWEGSFKDGGFTHGMTHGDPTRGGRHGDDGLTIGRTGLQPIFEFLDGDARDQPWLIWYAPFLPHAPHNPPARLLDKYRDAAPTLHVARYWAMCERFDETVGELLDGLDERGLAKDTLVVFVTDNGWIQREDTARYAPRSKRSPYDGGIRTPIMFRWPGHIAPRRDEETLVSSIDLAPTILSAVGAEVPTSMAGMDLMPATEGKQLERIAIFGEIFSHNAVDLDDPQESLLSQWVIAGEWKLILPAELSAVRLGELPRLQEVTTESGRTELYNLRKDPHEANNLAADNPELVERMTLMITSRDDGSGKP